MLISMDNNKLKKLLGQRVLELRRQKKLTQQQVADKMGVDKPHPVSHVAYSYATQVCILNDDGTINKIVELFLMSFCDKETK